MALKDSILYVKFREILFMDMREWMFDELAFSGTDFTDLKVVQTYDEKHSKFRDYKKETEERLGLLKLGPDSEVIDFGCGTGAFTVNAASLCRKIYAVDVSKMMLEYTAGKAEAAKLKNIEFLEGGMLTYEHKAPPVDAVISSMVLHHLPDFWKQVALKRIHELLKPGGKFFLFDVVFSFDCSEYETLFASWVEDFRKSNGDEFAERVARHLSREYSTFSWILEGLLEKAGFKIETTIYEKKMLAKYVCARAE